MVEKVTTALRPWQQKFLALAAAQKATLLLGALALVIGGVMVLRWATAPSYAPLFTNLSAEDASAVVEELESQGVQYELSSGGGTVMVPREVLYDTRIALSGQGLPGGDEGGYSILDTQSMSTSEFQEQTDFKRAMEGELSATVEAIDGVKTAVVHLAIPEKQVFADEQEPTTASVLVDTVPGSGFGNEQVQAVVHLVASSIDGLDPDKVTVADATGRVLSSGDDSSLGASTRAQQVREFEDAKAADIQAVLDRVVGPGNATVEVTAELDFDKAVSETTTYETDEDAPALSSATSTETYDGPAGAGAGAVGGVVGPDGQMDDFGAAAGGGESRYRKEQVTQDAAVGSVIERRESAPGSVATMHVGVMLDSASTMAINPADVEEWVASAVGIQPRRGDTVQVTQMPFDRSLDEANKAALEAAEEAAAAAQRRELITNIAIGVGIALLALLVWLARRRKLKARREATTYVVEQLRAESEARVLQEVEPPPALAALEDAEQSEDERIRLELASLVERQPDEVAALLRGWLVESK